MRRDLSPSHVPLLAVLICIMASGCTYALPQSALHPAGRGAELVAELFWWMAGGAVIVWLLVMVVAIWAQRRRRQPWSAKRLSWLIIGGGAIFPTVVLTLLLVWGLWLLAPLRDVPEHSLQVHVTGEQWWWRVRYPGGNEATIELANELWLPVNEPVEIVLESHDVIHAFWVPALGGKMDMIPGRTTRLLLEPTRTGIYRGACAEYCGTSHALMAFHVRVVDRPAFDAWLRHQANPAPAAASVADRSGEQAFLRHGCGACHTVRGTPADGRIGPDLTHVGGRLSLAAGTLPASEAALARWVRHPVTIKPEVKMPAFDMLPPADVEALAHWLSGLK